MAQNYDNIRTATLAGDGSGYVLDLGQNVRGLTATVDQAGGECFVRAAQSPASAPSAPGATPAASAKALSAAGWVHLKNAGDTFTWPLDPAGFRRYLEIWDVGAGAVRFDGTPTLQQK